MESRIEKAHAYHRRGFNCAQAVACAYCDLVGVDEKTAFAAAEAFGLGMGCMEGTCGALSGAVLLAGFKNSCADVEHPVSKGESYKLSRQIIEQFKEKNTSIVCKELKGITTGTPLRSCPGCIEDAARIAQSVLFTDAADEN